MSTTLIVNGSHLVVTALIAATLVFVVFSRGKDWWRLSWQDSRSWLAATLALNIATVWVSGWLNTALWIAWGLCLAAQAALLCRALRTMKKAQGGQR